VSSPARLIGPPEPEPAEEAPSGWSAIPAGVLAGALGCCGLVLTVLGALALWDDAQLQPTGVVVYLVLVADTAALLTGAVLLLRRRPSGQLTVAAAAAVAMCGLGYVLIAGAEKATDPRLTWERASEAAQQLQVLVVAGLAVVVVTLVLALLPATGRWCTRDEPADLW
jgi:hypothetical protein